MQNKSSNPEVLSVPLPIVNTVKVANIAEKPPATTSQKTQAEKKTAIIIVLAQHSSKPGKLVGEVWWKVWIVHDSCLILDMVVIPNPRWF